ncbi:MAG: hypothetical protein HQM14_18080 [SAR324 cluster bacterium]|nr:hypothetical protein [SAR324 cluster bacterium]
MISRIMSGLGVILVLIFVLENFDIVFVRFILGPPIQMPLAFVWIIGFTIGYLLAAVNTRIKIAAKRRRERDEEED